MVRDHRSERRIKSGPNVEIFTANIRCYTRIYTRMVVCRRTHTGGNEQGTGMQDRHAGSSFSKRASFPRAREVPRTIALCWLWYNGDGIINETSATNLGQGVAMGSLWRTADCHLHHALLYSSRFLVSVEKI